MASVNPELKAVLEELEYAVGVRPLIQESKDPDTIVAKLWVEAHRQSLLGFSDQIGAMENVRTSLRYIQSHYRL